MPNWQLLRCRAMERQSTDSLAVGLLHDYIVLELQADLLAVSADEHTGLKLVGDH
jgi:hypothetical protein